MSLIFTYVKFPLVDAFSLPPNPHFIINESQEGVIEQMDVVVTREHTYFKRTCFIASTLTVHKFISYSSTGAMPALHLLVMTDQYPTPTLLVVFFLQQCLMIFSSSLEGTYRQKQVTVIQTARTTLQITNFKHSWVWLQSSYV